MAANKLFDVNELLEAVLLELPFKEMFLAKAVCKSWKQLIEKSTQIKRAMFLKPRDGAALYLSPDNSEWHDIYGALIESIPIDIIPIFKTDKVQREIPDSATHWTHYLRFISPGFDEEPHRIVLRHLFIPRYDANEGIAVPSAYRSTYLTQPPVALLLVTLHPNARVLKGMATVVDKNGITLGLLANTVATMLKQLSPEDRCAVLSRTRGITAVFRMEMSDAMPMEELPHHPVEEED